MLYEVRGLVHENLKLNLRLEGVHVVWRRERAIEDGVGPKVGEFPCKDPGTKRCWSLVEDEENPVDVKSMVVLVQR